MGGPTAFQPVSVRQVEDDRSTHFGVDRVAHVEDVSKYKSGQVVVEIPVTAGSFSRLSVLAEAYQQVRYVRLDFKVASYAAANVGGGYVAGFVKDPDDKPPRGENAKLNWITAQPGSCTVRWPQQATVAATVSDRWFYTSQGTEVREFSPGSFYLLVDSKATAAAALTVWAHWRVSFRKATVEPATVKSLVAARDLFTQNGHAGLFYKRDGKWLDDNDSMFPGWKQGMSLRLPAPVTLPMTVESGVTSRIAWWLKFTSANDCLFCYEKSDSASDEKSAAENLVVVQGTSLEIEQDTQVLGEAQGPPPSASLEGASSSCGSQPNCYDLPKEGLKELASSLSSASHTLERLLLALGPSLLRESSPLTGCRPLQSGSCTIVRPQSPPLSEGASSEKSEAFSLLLEGPEPHDPA